MDLRKILREAGAVQAAIFSLVAASPLVSALSTIGVARGFDNAFLAVVTTVSSIAGFAGIVRTYFELAPPADSGKFERLRYHRYFQSEHLVRDPGIAATAFVAYYYLAGTGNPLAVIALALSSFFLFSTLARVAIFQALRAEQSRIAERLTPAERRRYEAENRKITAMSAEQMKAWEEANPVFGPRRFDIDGDLSEIRFGRATPIDVEGTSVRYYELGSGRYVIAPNPLDHTAAEAMIAALDPLRRRHTNGAAWITLVVPPETHVTDQALGVLEAAGVELHRPDDWIGFGIPAGIRS